MTVLTVDLGTTAIKATVWDADGPIAIGRTEIATSHPHPGWAEQDPGEWWHATCEACAAARAGNASAWDAVDRIAFAAARETFVPVDVDGRAIGVGILWSDRRAGREAEELAGTCAATGVVLDPGAMVAKVRWLERHDRSRVATAAWLLAPRDLVVHRLTGRFVTDDTLASRTGFLSADLSRVLVDEPRLPPRVAPTTVVGEGGRALGLARDVPVVIGAGDRACEVVGAGATSARPVVSWGTTTAVAVPAAAMPDPRPRGVAVSAGATGGFVLECGVAAGGAALAWLATLTHHSVAELLDAAAASPPGARGVHALPWVHGARAPWWHASARAVFTGLTTAHDAGDLARAVVEAVADDVRRTLALMDIGAQRLCAAGAGAAGGPWLDVLAAVIALPVEVRASSEAASAGACVLATGWPLDTLNPVSRVVVPDEDAAAFYGGWTAVHGAIAEGARGWT